MQEAPQFTIVGAGLAGTLFACHLARLGYRIDLYEKRVDPRSHAHDHGRSINLALSLRGIEALREVGLADEVLKSGILMRGRMIHSPSGQLTFQPYGKDDREALYSVSRAGLNRLLVETVARHANIRLTFAQKCTGANLATGAIELFDEATQTAHTVATQLLIGADGAFSAVRTQMQKQERFNYAQDYLTHGYKELTIPAGPNGLHRMDKHALHIWPRGSFMMIALPNHDGSFTCTLFWPFEGPNSFAALKAEVDILAFFRQQFPDAVPLLPTLAEDFLHNPTGSLVTIRCEPWHTDRAVLLGDAAHAVVPFLGQGMNAAFEDCTVLAGCIKRHAPAWLQAFAEYQALRKKHLDVLADLCVDNFVEMRDRVGSRWFLLRKKLDGWLHRISPRWYLPLYTMIEFTRIPYADAVERDRRQQKIVGLLLLGLFFLVCLMGALVLASRK